MVFSPTNGSTSRQRAIRVIGAQVPVPQLLGELDRRLPADLLAPDDRCVLLGLGLGVTEDEGGGRQYQQFVMSPTVFRQPALDVGEERLAGVQGAVPGEDGIRG